MQPTTSGLFGISWPWKVYPVWIKNDELISQAIKMTIFTALKSRKKNLSFGSDALKLVFESQGPAFEVLVNREIGLALAQHLPVITVLNIDITQPEKDNDPVEIVVYWERNGVPGETQLEVPKQ